jgi:UDP-glucose 4-epimerase
MDSFFRSGTRVLVTGGMGFIGSSLVRELLRRGCSVVVLDNLSTGRITNLEEEIQQANFHFVNGSVLDIESLEKLISNVEFCFHLAASVGVRKVVENPEECLDTIVRGGLNVVSTCTKYKRPLLITSTREVYGKIGGLDITENSDRLIGVTQNTRWIYSESKAIDEMLALLNAKKTGLPTYIVRLFNTVGPGQVSDYGMVIPNFVKKALLNEPITVFGNGGQVRAFCHVEDAVDAMLQVAQSLDCAGEIYNIGSSEEITILDLAKMVKKLCRSNSDVVLVPYEIAYPQGFEDIQRRVANTQKLKMTTSWAQKWNLETTLIDVINYWKTQLSQ